MCNHSLHWLHIQTNQWMTTWLRWQNRIYFFFLKSNEEKQLNVTPTCGRWLHIFELCLELFHILVDRYKLFLKIRLWKKGNGNVSNLNSKNNLTAFQKKFKKDRKVNILEQLKATPTLRLCFFFQHFCALFQLTRQISPAILPALNQQVVLFL